MSELKGLDRIYRAPDFEIYPGTTTLGLDANWLALSQERKDQILADFPELVRLLDEVVPEITGPAAATGATSAVSIVAGATAVHTFTSDEAEDVVWSIGGADVAKFTIVAATGVLAIKIANSVAGEYVVAVTCTDRDGNATTQTVTVTVTAE